MSRSLRLTLACLALPIAFGISSCSDGLQSGVPSTPTGGTPTPTATPAPTAAATPTPSQGLTCNLPPRPDCGNSGCCPDGGERLFDGAINNAQRELERTRPDIFFANGSLRLDELEYTDLLAATIVRMTGLCARGGSRDGGSISKDEVAIKQTNDLSQNVDVIIGSSHTPYIGGRHTCRPASF